LFLRDVAGSTPVQKTMRSYLVILLLMLALQVLPLRRAVGEDRLDFKYMYYQEDGGRIGVQSPSVLYETDLSPTLSIKLAGIYNAISGATPTGIPSLPKKASPAASRPSSSSSSSSQNDDRDEDDDHDGEQENESEDQGVNEHEFEDEDKGDDRRSGISLKTLSRVAPNYAYRAGASSTPAPAPSPSPAPAPAPSSSSSSSNNDNNDAPAPAVAPTPTPAPTKEVDTSDVEDERWAFNIDVTKRMGDHSVGGSLSVSTESDYDSYGLALRDAIDFNKKNTTLLLGAAYTYDLVDVYYRGTTETKDTLDAMVGLTQVLSPRTLFTVNLTLSQVNGFMADPYKVVDLDGELVPEVRPDNKDKRILFLAINQAIPEVDGSLEVSYRFYDDTFGIQANTWQLAWYQKLGRHFVLRPSLRWYEQTEADFYGLHFTGTPEAYSSDYRVSALRAIGYGLKLIWTPNSKVSFDIGYERYEQEGTDGVTPSEMYPGANVMVLGARWWL
jgi:hypothetical protein